MRFYRIFLLLLPFVLLTGFVSWRWPHLLPWPPPAARSLNFAPLTRAPADPLAGGLLDRALALLEPGTLQWLEMNVWQRVALRSLSYEAEGRLLLGPEERYRLELTTKSPGGKTSSQLLVSDGINFRSAHQGAKGEWIEEPTQETAPSLTLGRGGLAPLLKQLRLQWTWVQRESLGHGEQVRLTGVAVQETDFLGTPGLLRACRITLESDSLWPCRVEWWGPPRAGAADELLIEMEFRNPKVNQPLPLDRCVQEFHLRPGATVVTVPFTPTPSRPPTLSIPGKKGKSD